MAIFAGYMSDLNGPRPNDPDPPTAWEFFGSSITEELDSDVEENGEGCDVLADCPSDNEGGVLSAEQHDVLFDFSDSQPPELLNICVDKTKGYVPA